MCKHSVLSKLDSSEILIIHTFRQYSISSLIEDKLCFILEAVLKLCCGPTLLCFSCFPANLGIVFKL